MTELYRHAYLCVCVCVYERALENERMCVCSQALARVRRVDGGGATGLAKGRAVCELARGEWSYGICTADKDEEDGGLVNLRVTGKF